MLKSGRILPDSPCFACKQTRFAGLFYIFYSKYVISVDLPMLLPI